MKALLFSLLLLSGITWGATPTATPTPTSEIPDWLLALPTIPASEQIYTTPEKTPTQPKILPTATPTPGVR